MKTGCSEDPWDIRFYSIGDAVACDEEMKRSCYTATMSFVPRDAYELHFHISLDSFAQ